MRYSAKVDDNQSEIVAALRKIGSFVVITSQLKNAFDILVFYQGKTFVIEIKDGKKHASKRKLTPGEIKCKQGIESVGCKYHVVNSIDEAIKLVTS